MALKKTDYTVSRGIEKLQYKRGVKINDKVSNLCVTLVKNRNKGFYQIDMKVTSDQITEDQVLDQATLKTMAELALAAMSDGAQWREEWHDNQPKDTDQKEMFGEGSADDVIPSGFTN